MWISRKRFKALEKRIADLEVQVQSQQTFSEDAFIKACKEALKNEMQNTNPY